jgi:hypothetical protein
MTQQPNANLPLASRDYLAQRLDGARDLYLLALALGDRPDGPATFGQMIRESRIHFAAVIEEARIAGLETREIATILAQSTVEDGIRPDLRARVEQLLIEAGDRAGQRGDPR